MTLFTVGVLPGEMLQKNHLASGFSIFTPPALSMLFCWGGGGSEKGETVDGSENPQKNKIEIGSLSHYLRRVLYTSGGWEWDF